MIKHSLEGTKAACYKAVLACAAGIAEGSFIMLCKGLKANKFAKASVKKKAQSVFDTMVGAIQEICLRDQGLGAQNSPVRGLADGHAGSMMYTPSNYRVNLQTAATSVHVDII